MLIAYLDDASRFIVGHGIFDKATTENAISVLGDCINRYGKPPELLTDHGSQFYVNFGEIKASAISKFQKYLLKEAFDDQETNIGHVFVFIHNPDKK